MIVTNKLLELIEPLLGEKFDIQFQCWAVVDYEDTADGRIERECGECFWINNLTLEEILCNGWVCPVCQTPVSLEYTEVIGFRSSKMRQVQELFTEYLDLPFSLGEYGASDQELSIAQARVWNDTLRIIKPMDTCPVCGQKFPVFEEHVCF